MTDPAHQPLLGKPLASGVTQDVREALKAWSFQPHLVSVLASADQASRVYVHSKERQARRLGVRFGVRDLGPDATQGELHAILRDLSDNPDVHGVVLELPLSPGLDADAVNVRIV